MRKLLLDTNILIDIVSPQRPSHGEAWELLMDAADGRCALYALTSSLKDVYFIFERHYGSEAAAREAVRLLRDNLALIALEPDAVDAALESDEPDLEDGLVKAVAEGRRMDAIVTRDKPGFASSAVRKATALEAHALLQEGGKKGHSSNRQHPER